jgi:hypothetical protein
MRTVDIAFDPSISASLTVAGLRDVEVHEGDHLRVSTAQKLTQAELFMLMLVVVLIVTKHLEHHGKRKTARLSGDRILSDLFAQYASAEEIEKELEREYGIEISLVERDHEDADWLSLSTQALAAAYGAEEPDYSTVIVGEPNPNYRRDGSQ